MPLLIYVELRKKKNIPSNPSFLCGNISRRCCRQKEQVVLFIFLFLIFFSTKKREGSQNVNTTLDFSDCFLSYSSYESKQIRLTNPSNDVAGSNVYVVEGTLIFRCSHCGNFMIFLSLRFYVKSIFGILKVQKFIKHQNLEPLNVLKWQILQFENPEN